MAIDINRSLFSDNFVTFATFAQTRMDAGMKKDVIRAEAAGPLADRTIKCRMTTTDRAYTWKRADTEKIANNDTRTLFRETVERLFGGAEHVPQGVRKAMLLSDYGKGRPLTARRIVAVKDAIMREKMSEIEQSVADAFKNGKWAEFKQKNGYTNQDIGRIARAAGYYLHMNPGASIRDAMCAVTDINSPAGFVQFCNPSMTNKAAFEKDCRAQKELDDLSRSLPGKFGDIFEKGKGEGRGEAFLADVSKFVKGYKGLTKKIIANVRLDEHPGLAESWQQVTDEFAGIENYLSSGQAAAAEDGVERVKKRIADLSGKLFDLGRDLHDAGLKSSALVSRIQLVFSELTNELNNARSHALGVFHAPKMLDQIGKSAAKVGVKVPEGVSDGVAKIIEDNANNIDKVLMNIPKFAGKIENGRANFTVSDEKRNCLRDVLVKMLGEEKGEKSCEKLVADIERSCFLQMFKQSVDGSPIMQGMADTLAACLAKREDILSIVKYGFKDDCLDKVRDKVTDKLSKAFVRLLKEPATNNDSLKLGCHLTGIREYESGFVKFRGENLPNGKTPFEYTNLANNPRRRGFCEFLEEKFDQRHVQMRRLVSLLCSMAQGVHGTINDMLANGEGTLEDELCESKHPQALMGDGAVFSGEQAHLDTEKSNYDIDIAENGDVTIKVKVRAQYNLTTLSDDKPDNEAKPGNEKDILAFEGGCVLPLGSSRYEMTIKIPNISDIDLNGEMPDFTISDFQQFRDE